MGTSAFGIDQFERDENAVIETARGVDPGRHFVPRQKFGDFLREVRRARRWILDAVGVFGKSVIVVDERRIRVAGGAERISLQCPEITMTAFGRPIDSPNVPSQAASLSQM